MATRNIKDSNGAFELGLNAEIKFKNLGEKYGFTIIPSSSNQDRLEHWDFLVSKEDTPGTRFVVRVEVKSMKRVSRRDYVVQDKLVWIELHGDGKDHYGWMNGKADLIAFEKEDSFIFVMRKDLYPFINSRVDFNTMVDRPEEALYKLYSRNKKHDLLTIVEMKELEKIKCGEWKK